MPKRTRKHVARKTVLCLPDLDHSKTSVLNSLSSPRSRRNYKFAMEQFIDWYCSEPRLALNQTVVLRFRLHLESLGLAAGTINQRLAAVRRLANGHSNRCRSRCGESHTGGGWQLHSRVAKRQLYGRRRDADHHLLRSQLDLRSCSFQRKCTSNSAGAITYSVVSGPATISGSTVTLSGPGTVVLKASQAASGNYLAGSQSGTFTVAAANAPAVSLTPANLTFASTTVGVTAAYQTVTLKNTGSAALSVSSFTVAGTNASSFGMRDQACGSTLAAGATCVFKVAFTPKSAGALTAAISIMDNATGSPQSLGLAGTGKSSTSAPIVSLTPASLSFVITFVGKTASYQTVTLFNTGSATLNISSFLVTGANALSFGIRDQTCGTTLAASANCTFKVAFNPATTGVLTAAVSITDNALDRRSKSP